VQFNPDPYDDKMFRTLFRFERSEMYELLSLFKSAGVLEDHVVTPYYRIYGPFATRLNLSLKIFFWKFTVFL
jgi:hypothetical protein